MFVQLANSQDRLCRVSPQGRAGSQLAARGGVAGRNYLQLDELDLWIVHGNELINEKNE